MAGSLRKETHMVGYEMMSLQTAPLHGKNFHYVASACHSGLFTFTHHKTVPLHGKSFHRRPHGTRHHQTETQWHGLQKHICLQKHISSSITYIAQDPCVGCRGRNLFFNLFVLFVLQRIKNGKKIRQETETTNEITLIFQMKSEINNPLFFKFHCVFLNSLVVSVSCLKQQDPPIKPFPLFPSDVLPLPSLACLLAFSPRAFLVPKMSTTGGQCLPYNGTVCKGIISWSTTWVKDPSEDYEPWSPQRDVEKLEEYLKNMMTMVSLTLPLTLLQSNPNSNPKP